MRQSCVATATLKLAPWAVACVLLLCTGPVVGAQDAAPAAMTLESKSTNMSAELPGTTAGMVGGSASSTMPAAEVSLASGGTGPMSLGALVGAGVAAVFALRERFKRR